MAPAKRTTTSRFTTTLYANRPGPRPADPNTADQNTADPSGPLGVAPPGPSGAEPNRRAGRRDRGKSPRAIPRFGPLTLTKLVFTIVCVWHIRLFSEVPSFNKSLSLCRVARAAWFLRLVIRLLGLGSVPPRFEFHREHSTASRVLCTASRVPEFRLPLSSSVSHAHLVVSASRLSSQNKTLSAFLSLLELALLQTVFCFVSFVHICCQCHICQ